MCQDLYEKQISWCQPQTKHNSVLMMYLQFIYVNYKQQRT